MKQRPQHQTPEHDDDADRERGGRDGQREPDREIALRAERQHGDHEQQRRDREVLKQQNREAEAPDRRRQQLVFGQHGNDDRRRGQGKSGAEDERRRGLLAEQRRRPGDRRRADDDLRETEPEHQPAQALQTLEGKFEPHREEQDDDPEGREPIDRHDVGERESVEPRRPRRQTSEARRAQRDAGQQIAQDRADVNAEKQRRDHARRDEEKQRFTIDRCVVRGVHGRLGGEGFAVPSLLGIFPTLARKLARLRIHV